MSERRREQNQRERLQLDGGSAGVRWPAHTEELLYNLLPTVYRQRDLAEGQPLRALLAVLQGQYEALENNITALYDDWFIETCDEWVVPYIAELIGVRGLAHAPPFGVSHRALVANTIAYRRRKGLASVLARVAQDATGWAARAVEFFRLLATTQQLEHVRLGRGGTVDLRANTALALVGTPFDDAAHTADVRALPPHVSHLLDSDVLAGKYNLNNLGLFVWRLQSYPMHDATPRRLRPGGYTFHPLGDERNEPPRFPLFNQPQDDTSFTAATTPRNVPAPLDPNVLRAELAARRAHVQPATDYFGRDPVFAIYTPHASGHLRAIAPTRIMIRDLDEWQGLTVFTLALEWQAALEQTGPVAAPLRREFLAHGVALPETATVQAGANDEGWQIVVPLKDDKHDTDDKTRTLFNIFAAGARLHVYDASYEVAVDPLRGRFMFPPHAEPARVRVDYSYGFSMDLGGGPYNRRYTLARPEQFADAWLAWVISDASVETYGDWQQFSSLQDALTAWAQSGVNDALIRIGDSGLYQLDADSPPGLSVELQTNGTPRRLVIEADDGAAPCVVGNLALASGQTHAQVKLNGLWLDGRILLDGNIALEVLHCTIKPRPRPDVSLDATTAAASAVAATTAASVHTMSAGNDNTAIAVSDQSAVYPDLSVTIQHSIVGGVRLPAGAFGLAVADSVVDGGREHAISGPLPGDESSAIAAPPQPGDLAATGPPTMLARATLFGGVAVAELTASDVIFTAPVFATRRERGGVRYSYVPPGSLTPRRYRCQPDLLQATGAHTKAGARASATTAQPVFVSTFYGQPGYAQLGLQCPAEIAAGAEDGAEMGVFHDLYQPQRRMALAEALAEYLPFGLAAGVFYVN